MSTPSYSPSHVRDLVAQLIHDDPTQAEVLLRLWVITDSSTPKGAAIRTDVMKFAYSFTEDCREHMESFIAA